MLCSEGRENEIDAEIGRGAGTGPRKKKSKGSEL